MLNLGNWNCARAPIRCVVAIPARNEASWLPSCLRALANQRTEFDEPLPPFSFALVLFANNCSDATVAVARALAPTLPFPVRIVEADLPAPIAHAGSARRRAMELAWSWLDEAGARDGVILSTDADSRVPPKWVSRNVAAIRQGADAVLGRVSLDEDGALLPEALHQRGRFESEYEALLTEIGARLDPVDYNPWPHHATISGASLGITVKAHQQVGGVPCEPLGEDKALIAELVKQDARIRYSNDVEVVTSGRVQGRAPGGVADTLLLRSKFPDAPCDEALEPHGIALRRARWRGLLRKVWKRQGLFAPATWPGALALSHEQWRRMADAPTFGSAWAIAESASPHLKRHPLKPHDLPAEIRAARRALTRLRPTDVAKCPA
jgi:cellulose synthase/poly-beta-1,6-N-acetylglucosamine synthase-like glycosyltransferase